MLEHIKFHKELLENGKWFEMSILLQIANIGAEVGRSLKNKQNNNLEMFDESIKRAYELFDLSIYDKRWRKTPKLKELCYLKELVGDYFFGDNYYNSNDEFFEKYFFQITVLANNERREKRLRL